MTFHYVALFGALLLAYMVYSAYAQLDPRLPILGALVLLVATALTEAAGFTDSADLLAEFVFLLLIAGVVLLLVDHLRKRPASSPSGAPSTAVMDASAPEPTNELQPTPHEPLDRLQEQPVAPVDAPSDHDDQDEHPSGGQPDDGK